MEELVNANLTRVKVTESLSETVADPSTALLPALLQVFATIGLGWVVGSLRMFAPQEARGLGKFVGKISLPALILISLISLDLSTIKWSFLIAILVCLTIILVAVIILALYRRRRTHFR